MLILSEEVVINVDKNSIDEVVKSSKESHNEKSKDEVDLQSDTTLKDSIDSRKDGHDC